LKAHVRIQFAGNAPDIFSPLFVEGTSFGMFISVNEIRVGKRVRIDEGDLYGLMSSLKKYGQLNPIIIDASGELIAGARRLEAAKRLGWSSVKAIVVEDPSDAEKLEIELEENMQRKELSDEEVSRGVARLRRLHNPGIFMRFIRFMKRVFRRMFRRRRIS
jgi:ParB family chromosome partitioning protein